MQLDWVHNLDYEVKIQLQIAMKMLFKSVFDFIKGHWFLLITMAIIALIIVVYEVL